MWWAWCAVLGCIERRGALVQGWLLWLVAEGCWSGPAGDLTQGVCMRGLPLRDSCQEGR